MPERFTRGRDEARSRMISLRVSPTEDARLDALRARLGLTAKADVLRRALDYWTTHAPEVKKLPPSE